MSRGLSRRNSLLDIKAFVMFSIMEKIDKMKSRLYNALVLKSNEQILKCQLNIVQSPYVILLSLRNLLNKKNDFLLSSDVGYFIVFFPRLSLVDQAVFADYYDYIFNNVSLDKKKLLYGINIFIVSFIFQIYTSYLLFLDNHYYLQFYQTSGANLESGYTFISTVDLSSIIYSLDFSLLLSKLTFINLCIDYLNGLLKRSILIRCIWSIRLSSKLIFLKSKRLKLIEQIVDFLILYLTYQVSRMFKAYLLANNLVEEKIRIYSQGLNILVISNCYSLCCVWLDFFKKYLKSNGIALSPYFSVLKPKALSRSVTFQSYNYYCIQNFNSLNLIISPSLDYQFSLLKQVKILAKGLTTVSIFLFVVRLNKMLVTWKEIYPNRINKRLFGLLDYLVILKIRSYYRLLGLTSVKLKSGYTVVKTCKDRINLEKKYVKRLVSVSINYQDLYRQYCMVRLMWF
uniref:Reverse transcriptase N-terminal domain-containing protein n=1 Tax=Neogoniolithon spectabile TaxID=231755 RepID=A0A3G3MGU5_9FLOR|nr:hypothetical protein [Neogoniolithon spectabile]AYR06050.1 hypothetical protein [Neogoniolithon spectabile]